MVLESGPFELKPLTFAIPTALVIPTAPVIPSKARDLGSCLHYDYPSLQTNTRVPRFARDDSLYEMDY